MELKLTDMPAVAESSEEMEHVKVLVLGAGPAGMSAALYAARAELNPVVLTGNELGGQASLTFSIENYPGFPEGVGGGELGDLFKKQAERFGARFEFDLASEVDLSSRPFHVKTYSREYLADSLIIATGASPNHLNVPREEELTGRGVSYCATCDGWFFKDKKVVVVGGGDSALEEAVFLTRYVKSVTIIHRRDAFRAGAILQHRARENAKIDFLLESVVTEIVGEEKVSGVKVKNVKTGEISNVETDGIFIFIGHTPNTELFKGQLEMDPKGIIVSDALMHTSVPGVFAAGEVMDKTYRQVVTSAGMGAAAAIEATRFLEREEVR
ncbi:thioredoxin-disulfide reductase [Longilinea arvoryzae]|uniref:Thioredoxin reductase n=1 Tax=Longilinea arvoryzae TaxID=360412 RepID=A0A0S7BAI5_9CHLR|nr:thioredoxin-disulfide reductase [Longilinea arvoryzae]GAP14462.1 thioredoxin-disulfide reductase [Longilinea arvoryzae]